MHNFHLFKLSYLTGLCCISSLYFYPGRVLTRANSCVSSPYSVPSVTSISSRDLTKSRDATKSRDNSRTASAGSRPARVGSAQQSRGKPARVGSAQQSRDKSVVSSQSCDEVDKKTAVRLKNPQSKRFVQSVWTKEFCKLMDLRMYSH